MAAWDWTPLKYMWWCVQESAQPSLMDRAKNAVGLGETKCEQSNQCPPHTTWRKLYCRVCSCPSGIFMCALQSIASLLLAILLSARAVPYGHVAFAPLFCRL